MSSTGWIDFSSEHRDKVLTVVKLLSEKGVIDELGIGVVRNTFANRLLFWIFTFQPGPKYFALTALLLKDYQEHKSTKRKSRSFEKHPVNEDRDCHI